MQGMLIFDLSDPMDKLAHTRATKADDCYGLLWAMVNNDEMGKRLLKIRSLSELRRELYDMYNEYNINPDMEYQ